jgi:actin-related protein
MHQVENRIPGFEEKVEELYHSNKDYEEHKNT